MIALLLLAVPLAWGAALPPEAAFLEDSVSPSAAARRLLAADADVARTEAHASGLPLAVDERGGDAPEIVVDLARLRRLPPHEAEAEYARALALAAIAAPTPLVETEQAARQWTAQVLLEAAAENAELSRALHAAETKPARGAPVFDLAAVFLAEFERDPREAYWSVEEGLPRESVRLTDLEDLLALRAADVRALKEPPDRAYASFGGRRYPAALVRAAFRLRAPGALERLREALSSYDTVGVEPLQNEIFRWHRSFQAK
jgi:hypothetical protein